MKIDDLGLKNYEWSCDESMNFEVEPTDELLEIIDKERKAVGNSDMVGEPNNEVWYNIYLEVDFLKKNVSMYASCNNGEKDDYAEYGIRLTESEKIKLLWKAFDCYSNEKEKEK